MKYSIIKDLSPKYLEYLLFLIFIIFIYYYLFSSTNLNLYYRQYDIIGNLISIHKNDSYFIINLINKILNTNDEIFVYKFYCFVIFILNLFSLFLFLNMTKLYKLDKIIIILIFSFLPNFILRMDYGHTTLLQYYHFFFVLTFFELFIFKNKKFYLLLTLLTILLSFLNDIQYGIYCFIIFTIYSIYKLGLKNTLKQIKNNFYLIFLSISLLLFIITIYKYEQIQEFIELKRLFFDLKYVNKYSLINPLEFFWDFNFIYGKLDIYFNDSIKNQIQDYREFLFYYSPNGPEFTFYYGPTLLICFFPNLYTDKRFFLTFILAFIAIVLLTLNSIYFFSLISIHQFFFPFIRSVQRFYIIFDILIILSLIKIFLNFNDNKWNLIKIIFCISTLFLLSGKDHKGIKKYTFSSSNIKEEAYFIELFELKNKFKFIDSANNKNEIVLIYNNKPSGSSDNNEIFIIK